MKREPIPTGRHRERTSAATAEADRVETLLQSLQTQARARKRRRFLTFLIACTGTLACLLYSIQVYSYQVGMGHYVEAADMSDSLVLMAFVGFSMFVLRFLVSGFGLTRLQRQTVSDLAVCEDVHTVGPLLEAWQSADEQMQAVLQPTLTRLLPRLQTAEAPPLSMRQQTVLCQILNQTAEALGNAYRDLAVEYADFLRAVLTAVAQVGQSNALPSVRRLAGIRPRTEQVHQIVEAARACLASLEERVARAGEQQTLLRAVNGRDNVSEVLLRAASSHAETQPEQLLRAVSQEEKQALQRNGYMEELPLGQRMDGL